MKNAFLVYFSNIRNMPLIYGIHKGSRLFQNYVSDVTFRNMAVSHGGGGVLLVPLSTPCWGPISVVWYVTVNSTRTDRVRLY
jgi:hypothetical protein